MPLTIDLIYFNAGGGHRAAAIALQDVINKSHPEWTVRLVNLFEVLDPKGRFKKLTGLAPEDLYNMRLKRGWTLGLSTELKVLQSMIKMSHAKLMRNLEQFWSLYTSDLVVSLVPNFNKVIYESVKNQMPDTPYVTVLTDMADYPPHFWIEEGLDQHIVCGTDFAVNQAKLAGYGDSQISQTSGMILKPAFYEFVPIDVRQERINLGLNPDMPTGVVMFGGQGSSDMLRIAKSLTNTQLILLCGHNYRLVEKLNTQTTIATHLAVGFTPNVEKYMRMGDFFIGKPGPASISEAIHMGMPVITTENAWTMPQERFNTKWIREHAIGIVIPTFRQIRQCVNELLGELQTYKNSVASMKKNKAVFEVVDALSNKIESRVKCTKYSI